jgi:hypothetical protein
MKVQPPKTPRYAKKDRTGFYVNIAVNEHARMQRRAAAANLSDSKYGEVAISFYADLEEAFGGPMTDQFRNMLLRNVGGMAAKLEQMLQ